MEQVHYLGGWGWVQSPLGAKAVQTDRAGRTKVKPAIERILISTIA